MIGIGGLSWNRGDGERPKGLKTAPRLAAHLPSGGLGMRGLKGDAHEGIDAPAFCYIRVRASR
jgi:hypothetical protein